MVAPPRRIELVACCVDDSDAAAAALADSGRLAELLGARLAAVRVVESAGAFTGGVTSRGADPAELAAGLREDGRRALAARVAEVLGAGGAELVVLQGDPPDEVVAWASEAGCDLLVAAAHRSRLARAILGSFTQAVARHAPCPVLVHRTR